MTQGLVGGGMDVGVGLGVGVSTCSYTMKGSGVVFRGSYLGCQTK